MPISSSDLAGHAQRFRSAVENDRSDEIDRESTFLYDQIIRPVAARLSPSMNLIVIPDGALHSVPFAALRDAGGRYLVEDHLIAVTPSATMFRRATSRLRRLSATGTERVLVIGNPRLDPSDAQAFPKLSGAEDEARDIATLYRNAVILTGADATKRSFLEGAGGAEIVHFGGHAVANDRYPLLSRLLLSRDQGGHSGSLFAHEMLDLELASTNLLVLAACSTAVGPVVKGEGPISLARPFLAAGVPSVVATLWDVDDSSSRTFFAAFYRSIRQGKEPVEALRTGQLALLRSIDRGLKRPASWAGFVAIGGVMLNGGHL
jgi:CHAT domain-containing protein